MKKVSTETPGNLSITLGDDSFPYKSIGKISWENIPAFAVLTGRNGSGKTQFLQILAYKLTYPHQNPNQIRELGRIPLILSGSSIGPDEVAYLPNSENQFRVEGSSISGINQIKSSFLQRLAPQSALGNIEAQILRERIQRKYNIKITSQDITREMIDKLPDDFSFMLEYDDVSASLSHVFVGYQIRRAEKLMDGRSEQEIEQELGSAPWKFVNEALASAEFEYRIIPPENKLIKDYQIKAISAVESKPLDLNDLSSGEKTILRTLLWLYNTKHNSIFPRIFLLDEPDAHLHPAMTRQFIDIIKNVLVDQYGIRVILTTHSPSTVALAPEDSIFVMSKYQPRIQRPKSQAEAIGLLTSGLLIVSTGTKFVFVEDEDDASFFGAVRDILANQGPNKDQKALRPAPSLVFMPASLGEGREKVSGGSTAVQRWLDKFDADPLKSMFRGIIDMDRGNQNGPRVAVLGRYSIENYQLDPLVVFGVLIEEGTAPSLSDIDITPGDEHLLRSLEASDLQIVVDYVTSQVASELGSLDSSEASLVEVPFTNGVKLRYPSWTLRKRGHDLLPLYQKVFGQKIITPKRLERSFRRIRLVPDDLADIMSVLQNS